MLPIPDTHFQYDRLQALADVRGLSAILNDGPMPSVAVYLVGCVVNYYHGAPVKKKAWMLYDRPKVYILLLVCTLKSTVHKKKIL